MSFLGLTDAGYDAPRAADFLTLIQYEYEDATGILVDWSRDTVLGALSASMAASLGRLSEGLQSLYDQRNPGGAQGIHADDAAGLLGVRRLDATASRVTLTLAGDPGIVILRGRLVEGGGTSGVQRWTTVEDVALDGFGAGTVIAEATATGPITAGVGDVDKIVTPVGGWTSVTNAAAATAGRNAESDAELLQRRDAVFAAQSTRTRRGMLGAILACDGVTSATVIENPDSTPATVEGIVLYGHQIAVIVAGTLTSAQSDAVALAIYDHLPDGVSMYSDVGWVQHDITTTTGMTSVIHFGAPTPLTLDVEVSFSIVATAVLAAVEASVESVIEAFFAALSPGDDVSYFALYVAIGSVSGVTGISLLEVDADTIDIPIGSSEVAVLGTVTIT